MVEEERPHPPPGSGWFAYPPEDESVHRETPSVHGPEIRFMWDYGVHVPLWADGGLLGDDPGWLREALGLSDDLIAALDAWGCAMEVLDATAHSAAVDRAYRDLDARAMALVDRLRQELDPRYQVTYVPW